MPGYKYHIMWNLDDEDRRLWPDMGFDMGFLAASSRVLPVPVDIQVPDDGGQDDLLPDLTS